MVNYYVINKDGTRVMDEDGNYLPPLSKDEAEKYIDGDADKESIEVSRFNKYQGY